MGKPRISIIPYSSTYDTQTVEMWRDSKENAIGQKEGHSFDDHLYFLNYLLPKEYKIELALIDYHVVGMIAYNEKEISQLYIHLDYQGLGIGSVLLARAKEQSSGKLTLYTFEVNKQAQAFYEKHEFRIIGRGHENEEGLPDLLYEWKLDTSH